jgi:hypothetical protein
MTGRVEVVDLLLGQTATGAAARRNLVTLLLESIFRRVSAAYGPEIHKVHRRASTASLHRRRRYRTPTKTAPSKHAFRKRLVALDASHIGRCLAVRGYW